MKKVSLFLLSICFVSSAFAETVFTFKSDADLNQTKNGITVVLGAGTNAQNAPIFQNPFYAGEYHPETRLYVNNTITISSNDALTDIKIVCAMAVSKKEYAGLSANSGTLTSGGTSIDVDDWKIDSWTGNAKSVTFTLNSGKQRQIYSIVVDGEALLPDTPEEKPLPTGADLLPTYDYPEPTNVAVPDTTIIKKEYAFIHNNILVHCELGSIVKAEEGDPDDEEDFGHPAYFNCNAEHSITFTASKPIKGIAIDGYVRKAFNATCDNGSITFLTNPDYEMEGWPALVIQDVNATSTTIYCPKQFRCYALHVYFVNNPDAIDMPTAIDNIDAKQNNSISPLQPTKILQNGQLFILRNNQTFSAQGQLLR